MLPRPISVRLLWLIPAAACRPPAPPPAPLPESVAPCFVAKTTGATASDTVRIALTEPVEAARAPVPGNDAEALVFRHLYEPLVDFDCEGVVRPALATAWNDANRGRTWTFTLRPEAAFWDGAPLDAEALLAGWRETDSSTVVEGVRADRRTVSVFLREARPVAFFAAPAMRVVKRITESAWAVGTGPWWVRGPAAGADTGLVALPVGRGARGRPLAFTLRPGADPRDLVDAGMALVLTRDPRGPAYVAARQEWVAVPLPWNRTYGLASRALGERGPALFDAGFVRALARDVVPGDARPAEPAENMACSVDAVGSGGRDLRRRLVYRRGDPVARAIAERLVARADLELASVLGAERTRGAVTAAAVSDEEFAAARARGDDLGYVVAVPGLVPPDCSAPLIQTRGYALVRDGVAHVVRDWDGPRIEPPGRPR